MELTAKLDHYGMPAWIGVMVLGFIVFWPIGLAILAYLIWSGRMACWKGCGPGRWYRGSEDRKHSSGEKWRRAKSSSGNAAFDEYREETLRRLEDEQNEFEDFLDRLRQAKDKAEFDQFMEQRRAGGPTPPGGPDSSEGPQAQPNT